MIRIYGFGLVALFAACGDNITAPPTQVTQTKMVNVELGRAGAGGGMISATPAILNCTADACTTAVKQGTVITLHAVPDAMSKLVAWTGSQCASAGTGECKFELLDDVQIGATFAVKSFELDVAHVGNGGGTVTSPDGIACGSNCSETLQLGATTTLTALATDDSTFLGWTGGGCTGTGPCAVEMSADTQIQAAFGLNQTLVVSLDGTGFGVVSSSDDAITCVQEQRVVRPGRAPEQCSETVAPGTTITLSAQADAHSSFVGWGGVCSGTADCTVTVDQAELATAQFAIDTQSLVVTKNGNGTGSVTSDVGAISCGDDCSATIPYDMLVTLTAVADSGASFTGWSGVDCPGTGPCTFQLDADTTVTATFSSYGGLYSVDSSANLWHIDATTFASTKVGNLGITMGDGDIAFDYNDGKLYLLDGTYLNNLYTVDVATATATFVGQMGSITNDNDDDPFMDFPEPALALAYDIQTGAMYMMTLAGSLYTVDTSTAAVTLVGDPDQGGLAPEGLIYDQLTEQLVAVGADYVTLTPIDPATATFGATIGEFSTNGVDLGATYDPDNSQYLVLQASGTMIDIDPRNDYAATSTTGLPGPSGALAYVPAALN
ncbi:MAG TPA: hypothetical protein VH143_16485 [Kofleriaceae bacterium]|nr:hypothetical protein [Kofleriaceae bacterium]